MVRKVAYVDTKGIFPQKASPAAILMAFCSAIPTFIARSGASFMKAPNLDSESAATVNTRSFFKPNSVIALLKASLVEI